MRTCRRSSGFEDLTTAFTGAFVDLSATVTNKDYAPIYETDAVLGVASMAQLLS